MIKENEPFLIEYNVRMGDPECQVILPRLKCDILRIINKSLNNQLKNLKIKWKNLKCMTIVLCSNGYPGKYKTGKIIKNIKKINLDRKSFIFHAGTYLNDERVYSSGGRVLNVTSTGMFFRKIRVKIIKIMKKLNWKYGFFRKDIGSRII